MRIVTLTPGATEIAVALGLESAIVAAGVGCRLPDHVNNVPRIKLHDSQYTDAPDALIDTITAFGRTAVLATNLPASLSQALAAATGLSLIDLSISTIDEMFDAIRRAGEGLGASSAAKLALRGLKFRKRKVEAATATVEHDARPRVLFLEGLRPLVGSGLWNPELVSLAGGRNLHGRPGAVARKTMFEHISVLDPDLIFIAANDLEFETIRPTIDQLADANSDWGVLRAVAHDRIFVAEAEGAFDTPGPSMIDGLELLAYTLHPHRHERPAAARHLLHLKRGDYGLSELTSPADD